MNNMKFSEAFDLLPGASRVADDDAKPQRYEVHDLLDSVNFNPSTR